LLLVGLAAADDDLFSAAGDRLARLAPDGRRLYAGIALLVVAVTTVLNLDTSVAFLSPVLVHTARRRGQGDATLLTTCILLSNAGSLLLPGSNLTNLIVLGHLHLSGARFAARMGPPFAMAIAVTAGVIAVFARRELNERIANVDPPTQPTFGLGLTAVVASAVLVLLLAKPALPVAAVGASVVVIRFATGRMNAERVLRVLGAPLLLGLFGVAVALGAAGRDWSGPARLLSHLDPWGTAAVAALIAVLVNNLPAASLLAARVPPHPFSLLIGLNIGPNLFVTGSLAWVLWWRSSREAGGQPSIAHAVRVGLVAVPLSVVAATGALVLGVTHG
jgi:arsenical pump membrane protein